MKNGQNNKRTKHSILVAQLLLPLYQIKLIGIPKFFVLKNSINNLALGFYFFHGRLKNRSDRGHGVMLETALSIQRVW